MNENESIRKCAKRRQRTFDQNSNDRCEISDTQTRRSPQFTEDKVTTCYQKASPMYHIIENLNVHSCAKVIKLITVLVMIGCVHTTTQGSEENQNSFSTISKDKSSRSGKSLFFDNPLNDLYFNNQYQNEDLLENNEEYVDNSADEAMSRARPLGGNKKKYENSPIYYIRIPPSPYVHVPGYGYVSEPQSLKPPPQVVQNDPPPNKYTSGNYNQNYVQQNQNNYQQAAPTANVPSYMPGIMNSLPNYMSQNYYNPTAAPNDYFSSFQNQMSNLQYQSDEYSGDAAGGVYPANTYPLGNQGFAGSNQAYTGPNSNHNKYQNSPIYNLPLEFLANGKPTHVYTLQNDIQTPPMKPTKPNLPDSPIYHLDKGPYVFNGKPTDIILLRDAYNALYDETINNFYP